MKAQSFFEQNGETYTQVGDVLIPNLTVEETAPIGRWGRMRKRYLKEQRPAVYSNMLLNGIAMLASWLLIWGRRKDVCRVYESTPALGARNE